MLQCNDIQNEVKWIDSIPAFCDSEEQITPSQISAKKNIKCQPCSF